MVSLGADGTFAWTITTNVVDGLHPRLVDVAESMCSQHVPAALDDLAALAATTEKGSFSP